MFLCTLSAFVNNNIWFVFFCALPCANTPQSLWTTVSCISNVLNFNRDFIVWVTWNTMSRTENHYHSILFSEFTLNVHSLQSKNFFNDVRCVCLLFCVSIRTSGNCFVSFMYAYRWLHFSICTKEINVVKLTEHWDNGGETLWFQTISLLGNSQLFESENRFNLCRFGFSFISSIVCEHEQFISI